MGDERIDLGDVSSPKLSRVQSATVADALVGAFADLGVEWAFGLVGGAIAPLCDSLGRSAIRCIAARHEAGATFAALEASVTTDRPTLVFTTTGPGLVNALNGAFAARVEGARVVIVSGATSVGHRGRAAVQELSEFVLSSSAEVVRAACDLSVTLDVADQLPAVLARLRAGLSRPGGFVAHIALPLGVQRQPAPRSRVSMAPPQRLPVVVRERDVEALRQGPLVLWVGHGARRAAAEVRALAEHTGALVMSTPHGKGIFPEDHPLFAGVTGFGGHPSVHHMITTVQPRCVLVLGSRLGEFSSIWDRSLLPRHVVHVDVDDAAFSVGFPDVAVNNVVADIGAFCDGARALLPAARSTTSWTRPTAPTPELRAEGRVRPDRLMAAVQRQVVDGGDAWVFAEPGNSFAWATHHLSFRTPRYRMSGFWASMGHQVCGAVGAALATSKRAVVITGDGSMLMNNEISTAAQYGARVTWIVLNDAAYGITEHGMRALGLTPLEPRFPRCDFAAVATAMGAAGFTAKSEVELDGAIAAALAVDGPSVVDVIVDNDAQSPFIRRIEALRAMGASG